MLSMSDSGAPEVAKGFKTGRPDHAVRKHFTNVGERDEKTKRFDVKCNYCGNVTRSARPDALFAHLSFKCTKVSIAVKAGVLELQSKDVPETVAPTMARASLLQTEREEGDGGRGRKRHRQSDLRGSFASTTPYPSAIKASLDVKLLRWVATSGISFRSLDSPFFLDLMTQATNGRYIPAGN
jgi:hypothetical protein